MNTSFNVRLNSSAIRSVTYDALNLIMQIWFVSSGPYSFYRVPEDLFQNFINSRSPGSFYNNHIRGRYQR